MIGRYARLSPSDLSNLRLETRSSPFHVGGLAIVDGGPLLDATGGLRLSEIRSRLERRLSRVPQLRRRVHFPGFLQGRALWVDDDQFDVAYHVRETAVGPPGGETELLDAAAGIMGRLLDRSRPLWELWFLTGLAGGRIGVLLKLHHAMADGMAALAIMGTLLDLETDTSGPETARWRPAPRADPRALLADSLAARGRALRRAAAAIAHPVETVRAIRSATVGTVEALRERSRAPRTSLNRRVAPGRRIRFTRLDLAEVRDRAHAAGAKVNDVVLDLMAGGLRDLLLARGEPVSGLELVTTVPVSLRPSDRAGDLGNQVGVITVPLPVGEPDAGRRLELIAAATRWAKADQHPAGVQAAVGGMAGTPVAQCIMAHQRFVNVFSTNLVGPPAPMYVLGARILDVLPVIPVAGNVAIAFCAISYAGGLSVVVTADATGFPDLDVVVAGMERAWRSLAAAGGRLSPPAPASG